MMRKLDKLALLGGGALLLLVLLLEVSSIVNLRGTVSSATDEADKLVDMVNNNIMPPRTREPLNLSGKAFAAWETPPIIIHPYTPGDFFPSPGK